MRYVGEVGKKWGRMIAGPIFAILTVLQQLGIVPGDVAVGSYLISVWLVLAVLAIFAAQYALWREEGRTIAVLTSRLTPRLELKLPGLHQWGWLRDWAARGGVSSGQRVPLLRVVNTSDTPVTNARVRFGKVEPAEIAILCPYPLHWYVNDHTQMPETFASIPARGTALIGITPNLGMQLMKPGPHDVTVEVWGDGTSTTIKSFTLHQWRENPYPWITEVGQTVNQMIALMNGADDDA
jgi:hypothetical protein